MSPSRLFFNTPTHTHAHGCQLPHWEWGSQGDSCRHRLACRRDRTRSRSRPRPSPPLNRSPPAAQQSSGSAGAPWGARGPGRRGALHGARRPPPHPGHVPFRVAWPIEAHRLRAGCESRGGGGPCIAPRRRSPSRRHRCRRRCRRRGSRTCTRFHPHPHPHRYRHRRSLRGAKG